MRTPVSFLGDRQGLKDLQEISGKTGGQAGRSRKAVKTARLTAVIIGLVCASFVLALHHMAPGTPAIIPGHPFLDAVIIGGIVSACIIMCRRLRGRHIREIEEIEKNMANPGPEPGNEARPR